MDSLKKISSMHIERLKKEEEEEQWISGEELNTEGSSDEEGGGGGGGIKLRKRRDKSNLRAKLQTKSKLTMNLPSKLIHTTPPSSPPPGLVPSVSITQDYDPDHQGLNSSDDLIEAPINISWKPKRGSIKLPNINLIDSLTSSTSALNASDQSDLCSNIMDNNSQLTAEYIESARRISLAEESIRSLNLDDINQDSSSNSNMLSEG